LSTSRESDAEIWVRAHADEWQALAADAAAAAHRNQASVDEALQTLRTYRSLLRHLATVRELMPGGVLVNVLERTCGQLHTAVNRPPRLTRAGWRRLFCTDIPAAAASVRVLTLSLAALLVASALAGWWLISAFPRLISLIATPQMIAGVEHGHLWTYQMLSLAPPAMLSAGIVENNVVVVLGAFCFGILFGLGAFYIIAFNGLNIGGLLAFTHRHGLGLELLKFTLAHGFVELSVICLAAAAGTALGESVIRPQLASRAESLRRRSAELAPLLLACALLLLGSGLIEGFISPRPAISIPVRLAIGLGYWTFMLLWLSGRLCSAQRMPAAR
jgi:uncharacterized membrane protein SpoIIM required for sporulation